MTGPWEIYAEQLFQRGHGHPLWDPQPTKHGEVLIGDVGYMRNGRFYRLFNATRSAEDEINRRYGVPAGFKPLVFEDYLLDRREGAIQADPLCSMSVKSMGVGAQAGIQGIGGGLQFECSEQQGAVLVIKDAAVREELHPSDTITDYMLDHHHTWYAFAKDRFGLALEKEDIIFVRGWAKTTEWAVAAFIQAGHAAQVTFNGQFGLGANASFFLSASRDVSMVWDHNSGPVRAISGRSSELLTSGTETGSDEPSVDQCIFLHYYKLKRRLGLFPRVMKAAAEPTFYTRRHPDGDHDGDTAEPTTSSLDAEYEIEQAPRGEQPYDPVGSVLDYILEHSQATIAIASDTDVSSLYENSEKVCDIPLLLLERRPVITVDARGCGKLSFSENTSASASTLSELELPNYHDIESGPSRTPLMHRAATAVASDVPATGPELKFKGKERDSDVTPNTSMAIDQPQLDIFKPTWTGRIQSNSDALLVIEAARRGKLPRITRPLAPSEREIIAPGIVLVFSESESGIRDWNDHLLWIQGGVQGNFRQCYQLDDLDKRVGMTKRIYSHTTDGDTYHLIAYDPNIASGAVLLPRASEDRSLASLTFIETTTSESDTEDTSESRHNGTAENIAPPTARRPARPPANNACKSCRRLHFRCDWNEQTSCERCLAMGIECLQPNSNPRKKPKRPKTTTPESSTAPDSSSGNPTAAEEAFQPYPWGVGSGSK